MKGKKRAGRTWTNYTDATLVAQYLMDTSKNAPENIFDILVKV
jgi:hypothetical protein